MLLITQVMRTSARFTEAEVQGELRFFGEVMSKMLLEKPQLVFEEASLGFLAVLKETSTPPVEAEAGWLLARSHAIGEMLRFPGVPGIMVTLCGLRGEREILNGNAAWLHHFKEGTGGWDVKMVDMDTDGVQAIFSVTPENFLVHSQVRSFSTRLGFGACFRFLGFCLLRKNTLKILRLGGTALRYRLQRHRLRRWLRRWLRR